MLDAVIKGQAELIAKWMGIGFIHGVMNTDNMSVACETIDYGPCAFMDEYHPGRVLSSIDRQGRYAYGNQPQIGQWNLARLTETLMPLLGADEAEQMREGQAAIMAYGAAFEAAYSRVFAAKIGIGEPRDGDLELVHDLLDRMTKGKADMTLTFRRLADAAADDKAEAKVAELFEDRSLFVEWAGKWKVRLAGQGRDAQEVKSEMRRVNPAFIPRNHLVEEAINEAVRDEAFGAFETLVEVLARPYEDQPGRERYLLPPRPEEVVQQTFCGT
ncbi:MAG: YdiU family protein, partial [Proteobacteria bacterium]|nr:YdiU family protein [Pseudomonadota bacterium]